MNNGIDLACSLSQSIGDNTVSILSDIAEVGLDSLLNDGLLKDIPFVSTAVSIYHIGHHVSELHHLKKLAVFIDEINNNIVDEGKRKEYILKLSSHSKKMNNELEYVLVLINRYLDYYKPRLLAKLYLSYLDKRISWVEFTEYSEVIDRLLYSDFYSLCEFMFHGGVEINKCAIDVSSALRLQSVGFVEQQSGIHWQDLSQSKPSVDFDYSITEFGRTFTSLCEKELREIYNLYKQEL